jgi:hypothetical protein
MRRQFHPLAVTDFQHGCFMGPKNPEHNR